MGTAKNAGTVYVGHLVFGNQVTTLQIWGYGCSLAGFLVYNVGKALPYLQTAHASKNSRPPLPQQEEDGQEEALLLHSAAAGSASVVRSIQPSRFHGL